MGDVVVTVTSDTTAAQKSWRDLGASMTSAMSQSQSALNGSSASMIDRMGAANRESRLRADFDRMLKTEAENWNRLKALREQKSREVQVASMEMGGGMRSMFANASYGIQDFVAVLQQGGTNSLGRALMSVSNNIGVMGASFGPWGIAVAGATAIILPLAANLFTAAKAAEEFQKKIDRATDSKKHFNSIQLEDQKFRQSLRGQDSKQLADTSQRLNDDIENRKLEIEQAEGRVKMRREMRAAEWLRNNPDTARSRAQRGWADRIIPHRNEEEAKAEKDELERIQKMKDELAAVEKRDADVQRRIPGAQGAERVIDKLKRGWQDVGEWTRNAFEKAKQNREEIEKQEKTMGRMIEFGKKMKEQKDQEREQERQKNQKEIEETRRDVAAIQGRGSNRLDNAGALRGSSEAIAAQLRANNPDAEQGKKLEELIAKQLEEQKKQTALLRKRKPLDVVGI